MLCYKLIVLFFITTITTAWSGPISSDDLWLKRQRRNTNEQKGRIVYGISSKEYQNNFEFNGRNSTGNSSNPDISIVTGSVLNEGENVRTDIANSNNVYVVLPRWYELKNYQTPVSSQIGRGDLVSSERRQIVQRMINTLTNDVSALKLQVTNLEDTIQRDKYSTTEYDQIERKLYSLSDKIHTLDSRLVNQQERLNLFDDDIPQVLHDIFDGDLGHLTLIIQLTTLEVLSLKKSLNN